MLSRCGSLPSVYRGIPLATPPLFCALILFAPAPRESSCSLAFTLLFRSHQMSSSPTSVQSRKRINQTRQSMRILGPSAATLGMCALQHLFPFTLPPLPTHDLAMCQIYWIRDPGALQSTRAADVRYAPAHWAPRPVCGRGVHAREIGRSPMHLASTERASSREEQGLARARWRKNDHGMRQNMMRRRRERPSFFHDIREPYLSGAVRGPHPSVLISQTWSCISLTLC
ncbi:hypothetical protein B0H19DRAFT_69084 [Mycena capillaripes]|nr:hypothetical protein B0H19DRAFT_69084 [Mycena capillaripes]